MELFCTKGGYSAQGGVGTGNVVANRFINSLNPILLEVINVDEKLGETPTRLANIEETISIIKELDENKDFSGFILIGVNDGKKGIKFHLSYKKIPPIAVFGAIEQYKYMFFSRTTKAKE